MKTLVIYYSRTGNTRFAAETVAAEIGADVEEVVDLKNRKGRLNYLPAGRDALQSAYPGRPWPLHSFMTRLCTPDRT